jgi:aspartate/glutamate racemase
MSESLTSPVEWLYGLEDYFNFSNNTEATEFLHDFVSTYYSDEPWAILKKLVIKSHSLDKTLFSKHLNCYINAINKQYNMVELASCLRDYSKEKILNAIHMYERNGGDIIVLNDAMSRSQVKSKIWLIEELENVRQKLPDPVYKQVAVFAGWYGQLKNVYDKRLTYRKMRIVELDRLACETSDYIFNLSELENYKVKSVNANINELTLHKNGYEWDVENFRDGTKYSEKFLPDLIINTSAEHMTDTWYNQIRFRQMESDPIVAIQSNNYFDVLDHVNCVHSIDHMKKKFPMREILYEGELQLKGYKRVMLIGKPQA